MLNVITTSPISPRCYTASKGTVTFNAYFWISVGLNYSYSLDSFFCKVIENCENRKSSSTELYLSKNLAVDFIFESNFSICQCENRLLIGLTISYSEKAFLLFRQWGHPIKHMWLKHFFFPRRRTREIQERW